MITYSERDLLESLGRIAGWKQALWAANCAERQFSVYALFLERFQTGDLPAVRAPLDSLWLRGQTPAGRPS